VHWRHFFESLVKRGLHGLELIISDAHSGLKAARQAVFPSVPWQRCQFHLQQNAQSYVPKQSLKKEVANAIKAVFNAPNLNEAQRLLLLTIEKYKAQAPKLSE
jgi:putative transposase